jgi:hypothetical protein
VSIRVRRSAHDLSGQIFGDLTVVELAEVKRVTRGTRLYWSCRCLCGNMVVVRADGLKCGDYKSCGCRKIKQLSIHGGTGTPEHGVWVSLFQRCRNPNDVNYKNYGGRGIDICERWAAGFEAFLADMGPRPSPSHSIERGDNDLGYSPDNCRWATKSEQSNNRRNTVFVEVRGERVPITVAARRYGINPRLAHNRYKRGVRGDDLFRPPQSGGAPCQ